MDHIEFITQYRNYPLFQNLKDEDISAILAHGHSMQCSKGQILTQQGGETKCLYFVMTGGLISFRAAPDGTINVMRLMRRGETCMDAVIFMGTKSPIGMQAAERSELLSIDRAFVLKYVTENAVFANNMLHILAKNYTDTVYRLPIKSAIQRTGYYLLQHYLASKSESFEMHFNRYFVASYLGMTFETLSRALSGIRKLGIDIKGSKVTVPCKCLLCSFCDEGTAAICPDLGPKCEERRNIAQPSL